MRLSPDVASMRPSMVVINLLVSRIRSRFWRMGWPVLAESHSRLSASVVNPVLIFFVFGSFNSSKRMTCNCFGEPTLKSLPACLWARAVSRATSLLKNSTSSERWALSTPIPVASIFASNKEVGSSRSTRSELIPLSSISA